MGMQTGKWRERGIAWGAVVLWHAVAGWWLLRTMHVVGTRADDEALQIVFVDRTMPPAPARAAAVVRHLSRTPRTRPPARSARVVTISPSVHTSPPESTRPLSAVFLDQARLVAGHPPGTFERQPFDRTAARLPGEGTDRFRMRSAITPQSAIVWVSKHLFYPVGYTADPCPRNRENIGNLGAGGDVAAMQQEVEFERQHCRP